MAAPKNAEEAFHLINRFTSLNGMDKQTTKNYETVKKYIIDEMCKQDKVFNYLANRHNLAGSYADNLKITSPNEFDLLIEIKLTKFFVTARIESDTQKPGNVKINISEILKKCLENDNTKFVWERLKKLKDDNDYLLQDKFQSWVQGILSKINLHNSYFESQGRSFRLKYTISGPAHTCHVTTEPLSFSMDLVPAVICKSDQWRAKRNYPKEHTSLYWHAIPKPIKEKAGQSNISWQGSYADFERTIIGNKNNLKNTCRILKKLRDRQNYNHFKSYFIKTMYLWECDMQPPEFWNRPVSELVIHMIERWIDYLAEERLPFYWDKDCNLLERGSWGTMCCQLKQVLKRLKGYYEFEPGKILNIFLDDDEINKLNSSAPISVVQSEQEEVKSYSILESIVRGILGLFLSKDNSNA